MLQRKVIKEKQEEEKKKHKQSNLHADGQKSVAGVEAGDEFLQLQMGNT